MGTAEEDNRVVADKDAESGVEGKEAKKPDSTMDTLSEPTLEKDNLTQMPGSKIAVKIIATSYEADKELLLGSEVSAKQLEEANTVQVMADELSDACKEYELMEFAQAPTRKRKGEPVSVSHSSLRDEEKEGSDNIESETRPIRPIINRRKLMAKDSLEAEVSPSKRIEDGTTKTASKFWKISSEETLIATSSDESKDNPSGQRRKMGAPRKKKKNGQDKERDIEEGQGVGEDKSRYHDKDNQM